MKYDKRKEKVEEKKNISKKKKEDLPQVS